MKFIITKSQADGITKYCKEHECDAIEMDTKTIREDLAYFGESYERLVEKVKEKKKDLN